MYHFRCNALQNYLCTRYFRIVASVQQTMVKAETKFPDKLHQTIRLYCTHVCRYSLMTFTIYVMFQRMDCTPQQVCNLVDQGKVQENCKLYGPLVNLATAQGLWRWNIFLQGVAGYKITYVFTVSVICERLLTNCDMSSYMCESACE